MQLNQRCMHSSSLSKPGTYITHSAARPIVSQVFLIILPNYSLLLRSVCSSLNTDRESDPFLA